MRRVVLDLKQMGASSDKITFPALPTMSTCDCAPLKSRAQFFNADTLISGLSRPPTTTLPVADSVLPHFPKTCCEGKKKEEAWVKAACLDQPSNLPLSLPRFVWPSLSYVTSAAGELHPETTTRGTKGNGQG